MLQLSGILTNLKQGDMQKLEKVHLGADRCIFKNSNNLKSLSSTSAPTGIRAVTIFAVHTVPALPGQSLHNLKPLGSTSTSTGIQTVTICTVPALPGQTLHNLKPLSSTSTPAGIQAVTIFAVHAVPALPGQSLHNPKPIILGVNIMSPHFSLCTHSRAAASILRLGRFCCCCAGPDHVLP